MAGAQGGEVAVVEAMLEPELNCAIDARDANGWTALHHACTCGFDRVARLLEERNCDIETPTRGGRSLADMHPEIAAQLSQLRAARRAREDEEAAEAAEAEE